MTKCDVTVLHCNSVSVTVLHCNSVSVSVLHCNSVSVSVLHCNSVSASVLHCNSVTITTCADPVVYSQLITADRQRSSDSGVHCDEDTVPSTEKTHAHTITEQ